jgi:hypothetical protein
MGKFQAGHDRGIPPFKKRRGGNPAPSKMVEMTVAIGAYFIGGLIVCADTNVVFGDGNVITGEKVSAVERGDASYAIANAGQDAHAGTMLAADILESLAKDSTDRFKIESTVKDRMKEWHSSYTQIQPPDTKFILAATAGLQFARLYFCEPPSTVTRVHAPIAVGCGSRIVDPLLPSVLDGLCALRPTLLRVAYLMYRAKKDHINLAGSQTDVTVVSVRGECRCVERREMRDAEMLGPDFDFIFQQCCLGMLSQEPEADQERFIEIFKGAYIERARNAAAIKFPSLDGFGFLDG